MTVVLDSWAILAHLQDTAPAAALVDDLLERERPVASWINLGEVSYVLHRRHGDAEAGRTIRDLRHHLDPDLPTPDRISAAARIKAEHPLAYADAFAAATAMACGAELWTGDPGLLVDGAPWRWRDLRRTTEAPQPPAR